MPLTEHWPHTNGNDVQEQLPLLPPSTFSATRSLISSLHSESQYSPTSPPASMSSSSATLFLVGVLVVDVDTWLGCLERALENGDGIPKELLRVFQDRVRGHCLSQQVDLVIHLLLLLDSALQEAQFLNRILH